MRIEFGAEQKRTNFEILIERDKNGLVRIYAPCVNCITSWRINVRRDNINEAIEDFIKAWQEKHGYPVDIKDKHLIADKDLPTYEKLIGI